ncbi:hypothetical protein GRF59_01175 [Paenibacillus sp. HJL G12]|uniref:Uncharacterized protein n=1 Tax=Paenibacillus dendrobii TaxID=2691084 RepID=A0A7X3LFJ1_9BACL|nr:hypothetical protein [Paenibacillus dendrobii]MWV42230.1 hypothetical protein [Paenibacillus dendrobii]
MEMKDHHSKDTIFESIKNLTEQDAKTFLNLIYATLRDNDIPSEKLISDVLSIYEAKIPRVVSARQKK